MKANVLESAVRDNYAAMFIHPLAKFCIAPYDELARIYDNLRTTAGSARKNKIRISFGVRIMFRPNSRKPAMIIFTTDKGIILKVIAGPQVKCRGENFEYVFASLLNDTYHEYKEWTASYNYGNAKVYKPKPFFMFNLNKPMLP